MEVDRRASDTLPLTVPDLFLEVGDGPVVRFYLVRHGQTEANDKRIVVGQADSPLTEIGVKQASTLGRTALIRHATFWRQYASDLGRAQVTAQLILGHNVAILANSQVILEPRLRELAKGAREGLPKRTTYEEARARFLMQHGEATPLPLLETEEQVWKRVHGWMFEVVQAAVQQHRREFPVSASRSKKVFSVLAVSHAGTVRCALHNLVREQLPSTVDVTPQGSDGATSRALVVPNTSVTIIDIIPLRPDDELWDEHRETQAPPDPSLLWSARLRQLTWSEHCNIDKT